MLRQRADYLKRLQAEPRRLTTEQAVVIVRHLVGVPKCPVAVGLLGDDMEAKEYACQIKSTLESAGFQTVRFEGFVAFELQRGLTVTAYNSNSNNPSALGIRNAFLAAGIEVTMSTNPNRLDPTIELGEARPQTGSNQRISMPERIGASPDVRFAAAFSPLTCGRDALVARGCGTGKIPRSPAIGSLRANLTCIQHVSPFKDSSEAAPQTKGPRDRNLT